MVRALFRQVVLLVASLMTSAALMAVVVTVDGGTRGLGMLDAWTRPAPAPMRMAQAPTTAPVAKTKATNASPF